MSTLKLLTYFANALGNMDVSLYVTSTFNIVKHNFLETLSF